MSSLSMDAPNLTTHELKSIEQALATGHVSTYGPYVDEFENLLSHYLGADVVCMQSGTSALQIALEMAGIGKGDEVILPALTFVGTINAVWHSGAIPVIVDVDRYTWNISMDAITKAITGRTKAIIPVHLYGNPCDMDTLRCFGVTIIEDAAEALGSIHKGRFCGSIGDYGALSFNGNKVITTGGGGALLCKDKNHAKYLITQAKKGDMPGYNMGMTSLEAALGIAQFERLPSFITHKWGTFRTWRDSLSDDVVWQKEEKDCTSNRWLTAGLFHDMHSLPPVTLRRVFKPLDMMPFWYHFANDPCKNAEYIYDHGYCLPSSTKNNHDDIREEVEKWKKEL